MQIDEIQQLNQNLGMNEPTCKCHANEVAARKKKEDGSGWSWPAWQRREPAAVSPDTAEAQLTAVIDTHGNISAGHSGTHTLAVSFTSVSPRRVVFIGLN